MPVSARTGQVALCRGRLAAAFAKVPLGFKLLRGPIVSTTNRAIFQMDVYRSARFGEYIRIWPGAPNNEIEVIDINRRFRQLVLRVKEARRRFTQEVANNLDISQRDVEDRVRAEGGKILREDRRSWLLELWTPSEERHMLCGKDDLHLFLAQVPDAFTVTQAHQLLKPWRVHEAEIRYPGGVLRQGEWFFLPVAPEEGRELIRYIQGRPKRIKRLQSIGPGGRPHIAEELVRMDGRVRRGRREFRRLAVYARGSIQHRDHRPLHLKEWRRVIRNLEPVPDPLRQGWID